MKAEEELGLVCRNIKLLFIRQIKYYSGMLINIHFPCLIRHLDIDNFCDSELIIEYIT